jgi:DNA helicase-2/ATP-dependent DNA helicase PcrA
VGLEEDLFPSMMAKDNLRALEEERRLFYVAITRAEENCVVTYAKSRFRNGKTMIGIPSRFLRDIDPVYIDTTPNTSGSESFLPDEKRWSLQNNLSNRLVMNRSLLFCFCSTTSVDKTVDRIIYNKCSSSIEG